MNWIRTMSVHHANGEAEVRYEKPDSSYVIESRKRAIPHSNRSGVWFHTSYFLIAYDGEEKEYWSLKDAKAAAEAMEV